MGGELCDEDGAGGVEALDDFSVVVKVLVFKAGGAPGGWVAGDGEEVFAAPRDTVQRAAQFAGCDLGVGGGCLFHRAVFGEVDDEVQLWVIALEAREVELRQVGRGDFAGAKQFAELADSGEGDLVFVGEGDFCHGWRGAEHGRFAAGVEYSAAGEGIKDQGRRDGVRKIELADGGDIVSYAVEAFDHELALFIGEG